MGGLAKKIPVTYALMTIGTLALTGFPFLAGFYSKDAILESAFAAHTGVGTFAWVLGMTAAAMTTFYSFRLVFMTFHGEPPRDHHARHAYDHAHESPITMMVPLFVLAAGSLVAGKLGVSMIGTGWFKEAIKVLPSHPALENAHHVGALIQWLPFGMFLIGLSIAYLLYMSNRTLPGQLATKFPRVYLFLLNAWYFDALYDRLFVRPAKAIGMGLWKTGDVKIIDDYGVNGVARGIGNWSQALSRMQSGYVYHYAFAMLIGVLVLVTFYA